jgi:hypothetical protein
MKATLGKEENSAQSLRKHVVVYSSGRSGSNRLLDIIDQHELTNCRNEIDAQDPVFQELCSEADRSVPTDVVARWNNAVERAAFRKGSRDRLSLRHKAYLKPNLTSLWCELVRHQKVRSHVLGITNKDWAIPQALIRRRLRDQIVPVFKISKPPQLFIGTHAAIEAQTFVHNIREPSGFLASWYNRFVLKKTQDLEKLYATIRPMALARGAMLGKELELSETFSMRSLFAAQLWLWRSLNEPVFNHLRTSPRYMAVFYHQATENLIDLAERVYRHAGFDFTDAHIGRLGTMKRTLFTTPHSTALDKTLVDEVIENVLAGSEFYEFVRSGKNSSPSHATAPNAS